MTPRKPAAVTLDPVVVPVVAELHVAGPSQVLNIVERLLWTAIQAFVGSLPATLALDKHNLGAVGYSGLAAGIAAVISLAKNLTLAAQAPKALPVIPPPA